MRLKSSPAELIVGSSQDIDDDMSDVEEVFIRDGRGGMSRDIENKPLMPSKKKHQHKNSKTTQQLKILKKQYKRSKCNRCCEPFCYLVILLFVCIIFAAIVLTLFPIQKLKLMFQNATPKLYQAFLDNTNSVKSSSMQQQGISSLESVPCQNLGVNIVWSRNFARLNSEAAVRKADLDGDGIEDLIIGFGIDDSITSFDGISDIPQCTIANGQMDLCEGGLMALNGLNGDVMWKYWTPNTIFSLFCKFDINGDRINDCIASGPGGLLHAIDGKQGKLLWDLKRLSFLSADEIDINSVDLYTINLVSDLDADGVPDIIGAHTDERFGIREGHIRLISGKTGKIVRTIPSPFKEEIFVPVQFMTSKDGTQYMLVLTGGQSTVGGVYKIRIDSFKSFHDDNDYTTIQRSSSGFLVPAVLADINGDKVDDFVVASFNSTVYAFDGVTNGLIWSFTFPSSETVSSIIPGMFDNDNVVDFMIKYNTGPGFPIYYYSQTTVLNGKNGKPLLDSSITDSGGPHSLLGGMSISLPANSGDLFLHFQTLCKGQYENAKDPYKFIPNSDIILQSRADICMLRYNTSTVLKLSAISRHVEPPGAVIFTSDNISLQLNQSNQKTASSSSSSSSSPMNNLNLRQPLKHPKMKLKLPQNRYQQPPPMDISVTKKQSNGNEAFLRRQQQNEPKASAPIVKEVETSAQDEGATVIVNEGQKQKAMKFREKQIAEDLAARRLKFSQNGFEAQAPFNDIMNKISAMDLPREFKDELMNEDVGEKSNDYDMYYDQPSGRFSPQSIRRNSNNRGVRSDSDYETPSTYETILHELEKNHKKQDTDSQTVKKVLDDSDVKKSSLPSEPRAETLWDIEIEKENTENHKNEIRRRRRDTSENQNILPAISSTGVLLASLNNKSNDSLDFVFVLNIRESESFPPLLIPSDIQCVEEKMSLLESRGSFQNDAVDWRNSLLKECINSRLFTQQAETVSVPKFDTQITVVRISISCTCTDINPSKETCTTFAKQQKWTEYMGNQLDGTYIT